MLNLCEMWKMYIFILCEKIGCFNILNIYKLFKILRRLFILQGLSPQLQYLKQHLVCIYN